MPEKTDRKTCINQKNSANEDKSPSYSVEKKGSVLSVTFTSGEHKGQRVVVFETSPSLAYFNRKK